MLNIWELLLCNTKMESWITLVALLEMNVAGKLIMPSHLLVGVFAPQTTWNTGLSRTLGPWLGEKMATLESKILAQILLV